MAKNFSRHGDDLVTRRYRALIDWRRRVLGTSWVRLDDEYTDKLLESMVRYRC